MRNKSKITEKHTDHRDKYAEGNPIGPKDTGASFMGVTEGGKYVPLGELSSAQAEEDAAADKAGDRMLADISGAKHKAE